jgi:uncharacterized protein (UPF0332 family)
MNEEQLKILIRYRIQQSEETLREAEILFNEKSYRGAINRAYYAMFYSVLALLSTKKLGTSKHSGALSLFDKEFVKSGIFPKEFSKSLRLAFDQRQIHDYGEIVEINKNNANQTLDDAKYFIKGIYSYLESEDYIQ